MPADHLLSLSGVPTVTSLGVHPASKSRRTYQSPNEFVQALQLGFRNGCPIAIS